MKIGIFSHYYRPEIGAPSSRLGDFAAEWSREHDVHVATCFPNHPQGVIYPGYASSRYACEQMAPRLSVHRCWSYVTPNKGFVKKSLGHLSFWLSCRSNIQPRLPRLDCAIGSSPTFFAAMAARSTARAQGVPFVMEVRDLWPAVFVDLGVIRNRSLIRLLERWEMDLYRSARRIVTVTESFRTNLLARGISAEKVVNIPNGADIDYWRPDPAAGVARRRALGVEDQFVVLYSGAHGISQGLRSILPAAARLGAIAPDVRFLFVGEGADKAALVAEAARLQLGNVQFIDPVGRDDLRSFYAAADVCLVPLRAIPLFDTFIPSKMFEILAASRPVIGSVRGEAAEILQRSGGADVVAPEDSVQLADAVLRLRALPSSARAAMGQKGREYVSAHYSRRMLSARYLEMIREMKSSGS